MEIGLFASQNANQSGDIDRVSDALDKKHHRGCIH